MAGQAVKPDATILGHIFQGQAPTVTPIFLNYWDKCVFKAEFPKTSGSHPTCFVRLEAVSGDTQNFESVAILQQLAGTILPGLVPKVFNSGTVRNSSGRAFFYHVVEFVDRDLLDDAWSRMDKENRVSVVTDIVCALSKLHSFRPSYGWVEGHARPSMRRPGELSSDTLIFGGPHTGFIKKGRELLKSIMKRRELSRRPAHCALSENEGAVELRSAVTDLAALQGSNFEMELWPTHAVFCHNDLNPRNIILQPYADNENSVTNYKLAAIIDWELAGFYPASYELGLQDTYIGGANRHISFYLMLKKHLKAITPRKPSQIALLKAAETIFMSQELTLLAGCNIPAHIRKRVIEHAKLSRDAEDPYSGWTYNPDLDASEFQQLEDDVIQEMTAKREGK